MDLTERGTRFMLGLMVILALLSLYLARPFLSYVLLGLITAFLLRNVQGRLASQTKTPRLVASLLVALVLLLLVVPLATLVTLLMDEIARFARFADGGTLNEQVRVLFGRVGVPESWAERVTAAAYRSIREFAAGLAQSAVPRLFEFFLGIFIYFFVLFYGLLQGPQMVDFVRKAVPLRRPRMDRLLGETGRALDAVFKGEILVALIQGALATIGWWLVGLPNPFLWGFIMTLLSIIPWTGAPLVIVPAGAWLALQGQVVRGVGFIAFGVLLVGMVDNVLRPYIIGRSGTIHPAIVLVGVLGGLQAFGLVGLFMGPLILVLLRAAVIVWMEGAPPPEPARS